MNGDEVSNNAPTVSDVGKFNNDDYVSSTAFFFFFQCNTNLLL